MHMKISSIHLQKFKRFESLKISNLPPARLVVLTGPNGCGKSTVFDGLLHFRLQSGQLQGFNLNDPYYSREPSAPAQQAKIEWHGTAPVTSEQIRKSIDIRSAYRHEPGFSLQNLTRVGRAVDEFRFTQIIHQDQAVSKNYQRLASLILQRNVDKASRGLSIAELQDELFGPIESSLANLFPGQLLLESIGDPLADGTFYFRKGTIPRFPYMNLSSGEKAAFDLVLDLGLKGAEFNDTVFCVDEPEAHMSTRLQGALLTELVRLLPANSQLWIATHSIGMLRRARELYEATPGDVAFIDFSDVDGDLPVEITPIAPTRKFWRNVLSIALDDLSELVIPENIVVCEGNPKTAVAGKNQEHDAKCYGLIFNENMIDVEFVSAGNSTDVQTDRLAIMSSIKKLAKGVKVIPLIDGDGHSQADAAELRTAGYRVLSKRQIESYLYDDSVLEALCDAVEKPEEKQAVLAIKQEELAASVAPPRNNMPDDVKKAAPQISQRLQKKLQLTQAGNDANAFMRNILCPLIKPGTPMYEALKTDIFG